MFNLKNKVMKKENEVVVVIIDLEIIHMLNELGCRVY
jgi:hypothetical protein